MRIIYDPLADAVSITIKKGKVAKTKEIDDNTILDYDKKGNVIGVELLFVKERIPSASVSEITFENMIGTKKIAA